VISGIITVTEIPELAASSWTGFSDFIGGETHTETLIRIIALAFMIVFGVAALGPTRIRELSDWTYAFLRGQESRGQLQRRSLRLASEIEQFLSERRRGERNIDDIRPAPHLSKEEWNELIWKRSQELRLFDDETMFEYKQGFRGEALGLFEELHRRGWISIRYLGRFEHPVNGLDIQDVINLLIKFGHGHDKPMTWLDEHEES
jgi:hypothetical protein